MDNTISFYFDVIDRKAELPESMFSNEPVEFHEGLKLEYAFDQIEENGDSSVIPKLSSYIDDHLDEYSPRKALAIRTLGHLGDLSISDIILKYVKSNHPDLSFLALSSLCELFIRDEINDDHQSATETLILEKLSGLSCSTEEAVECARALKLTGHRDADRLIALAESKMPEFRNEFLSLMQ